MRGLRRRRAQSLPHNRSLAGKEELARWRPVADDVGELAEPLQPGAAGRQQLSHALTLARRETRELGQCQTVGVAVPMQDVAEHGAELAARMREALAPVGDERRLAQRQL